MLSKQSTALFKALSEPIRVGIIDLLWKDEKPVCICHIAGKLGKDQSVIFRHIMILQDAGLIDACKQGKFLLCSIKDKRRIEKIMEAAR